MTNNIDIEDFTFLRKNAAAGRELNLPNFLHLDQPLGLWNYIRIANDVKAKLEPGAKVLDWGCGMGQMTYLLKRRGMHVTSYDVRDKDDILPPVPLSAAIDRIVSQEPTHLPFEDARFDAVLSCGVLEHVDEFSEPGNEGKSLLEIARVLKKGGKLLIYQLPQHAAWQESIIRKLKLGYAHPRRYKTNEIHRMLAKSNFDVVQTRRANLIPKNLTGMPSSLRNAYSSLAKPIIAVDGIISQTPLLRNVAGVLELVAQKNNRARRSAR